MKIRALYGPETWVNEQPSANSLVVNQVPLIMYYVTGQPKNEVH
jgi:hypothetical protein